MVDPKHFAHRHGAFVSVKSFQNASVNYTLCKCWVNASQPRKWIDCNLDFESSKNSFKMPLDDSLTQYQFEEHGGQLLLPLKRRMSILVV